MKPTIPQGTRDFSAAVLHKRYFILNTIKSVFELYGFQPLETPAMENLETLMGKYGEEGDKLIFRILNNGLDNAAKEQQVRADFERLLEGKMVKGISERALKYDLTIPFARYVAMHYGQLTFPFKRYQMQPVWRADRPQKGRYREFYQCDADIVGSRSLINEVEFVNIYTDVFKRLNISGFELRINSRKILAALANMCGGAENMVNISIAIDKLDKTGIENVKQDLAEKGLNPPQISTIEKYLNITGNNQQKLQQIRELFAESETGQAGIKEIEYVLAMNAGPAMDANPSATTPNQLMVDLTLARGLNYYTGIIFEVKAPPSVKMGSIGGGGRYDDLTGLFGVPNVPGVGISFGVDRIYDVMDELGVFPHGLGQGTQVLFFNLGATEATTVYPLLQQLRKAGIASEMYHEAAKMEKQFKYAEKKQIPFVIIVGSKEMEAQAAVVKNIISGQQQTVAFSNLSAAFTNPAAATQ